jgi:hypothetical protein
MLFRILLLVTVLGFWPSPSFASELTVSSKGKKEKPQAYYGNVVGFDGVTLSFAVSGEKTPRKFSADSTYIEITLAPPNAAILNDNQSRIIPGRIASSFGATRTRDTDLQRAQAQGAVREGQADTTPTEVDLSSCHDRGKDSILARMGFTQTTVSGKISGISSSVLTLQKTPQNEQTYNMSEDVIAITIGSCS